MSAKRRKGNVKCRGCNKVWTDKQIQLFVKHLGKSTFSVCNECVTVNKEFIVKYCLSKEILSQQRIRH